MFDYNKCKTCTLFEECDLAKELARDPDEVNRQIGKYKQACYRKKKPEWSSCSNCIRQDFCLWLQIRNEDVRIIGCPHAEDESNFIDIKQLLHESFNNQSL